MAEVRWLNDMNEALQRAKNEKKPVLLDFFNPG
ncbi:MAG: thioredoxin family protein [Syntrophorhabdaceae bacterium]|nr:thioredoxin family protein [Syntrophorhabdaceae bacterium]